VISHCQKLRHGVLQRMSTKLESSRIRSRYIIRIRVVSDFKIVVWFQPVRKFTGYCPDLHSHVRMWISILCLSLK